MPFVQSVCSVQCGDKRAVIAAAGVDMNNTLSPQGHITLRRVLTREKSHGAGKPEQEKRLRPYPDWSHEKIQKLREKSLMFHSIYVISF